MPEPTQDYESLRARITAEHPGMSRRLQEVGRYVVDNPQSVAFDTLAKIASQAGVHASTLVRFANHLGFTGFSDVQKVYKNHLLASSTDYAERVRRMRTSRANNGATAPQLLSEFSEASIYALEHLRDQLNLDDLGRAVALMQEAEIIHVCGVRRAFPVTMYFVYALGQFGVPCHAIDNLGAMQNVQQNWMGSRDLLIATTFHPYAEETRQAAAHAVEIGAGLMLLTDSELCPLTPLANVAFAIRDADVRSFRALTSTLCVAQTLCIALGYERETYNGSRASSETHQR
jgi:DNA-binding MurR/RpiR family transcriptional regulator